MVKCKVCGRRYFDLLSAIDKHGACDDCRQWYQLCRAWRNFSRRVREMVKDADKRGRYAKAYGYKGDPSW